MSARSREFSSGARFAEPGAAEKEAFKRLPVTVPPDQCFDNCEDKPLRTEAHGQPRRLFADGRFVELA